MKKIIIAVLILTGSSTVSFAQSAKNNQAQSLQSSDTKQIGVEMTAKTETDRMAKALTLSADQKTQIHSINVRVARNLEMVKQAGPSASPERTTHLMKAKDAEYKKILTADQYAKYEKMNSASNVGTLKSSN